MFLIQILVVANVISFIANALFTCSSLFREKRKIIGTQTLCHFLNSIAEFMQSAYSGMVQDSVMLLKNIVLLFVGESRRGLKLFINVICIIAGFAGGIVVTVIAGQASLWYAYCPIVGMAVYSIASTTVFARSGLSMEKTEAILKSTLVFYAVMQSVYGIMVRLYPLAIFSSITILISVVSLIHVAVIVCRRKKNAAASPADVMDNE